MAGIELSNISIEYPIFNAGGRSIKNSLIRLSTGGKLFADTASNVIVKALDNVSLNLSDGDRVALIGHNGAGKSTLLKVLAGIYEPVVGDAKIQGKVSALLDIMAGIETESTGYENIYMRSLLLGLRKKEIEQKVASIEAFTGLGDYLHMPIRSYSSGMVIRLAFAIATSIEPEILLIDEVFGVGDADFVDKAKQRIYQLLDKSSIVVFASHASDLVQEFCNKGIVMNAGKVHYFGELNAALAQYDALTGHH